METKSRTVVVWGWELPGGLTKKRNKATLGGNENFLKLDYDKGWTTWYIY